MVDLRNLNENAGKAFFKMCRDQRAENQNYYRGWTVMLAFGVFGSVLTMVF